MNFGDMTTQLKIRQMLYSIFLINVIQLEHEATGCHGSIHLHLLRQKIDLNVRFESEYGTTRKEEKRKKERERIRE